MRPVTDQSPLPDARSAEEAPEWQGDIFRLSYRGTIKQLSCLKVLANTNGARVQGGSDTSKTDLVVVGTYNDTTTPFFRR